MPTTLAPHKRITGEHREKIGAELERRYLKDRVPLRDLAEEIGRSYGFVHLLLSQRGVKLRPRGGSIHRSSR